MWFFGKKNKVPGPTPVQVRFDVHAHLLPGVDDGIATREEAFEAIASYQALGYAGVLCTPHVYPEVFDNDAADLRACFTEFQEAVGRQFPGFIVALGAEYMAHDKVLQWVFDQPSQLIGFGPDRKRILIELTASACPPMADSLLVGCISKGFQPVLAHVERYLYLFEEEAELLERWLELGVEFQMNLGSPAGQYGNRVEKASRHLLQRGGVRYLGTDMHRPEQLKQMVVPAWQVIGKIGGGFDCARQSQLLD